MECTEDFTLQALVRYRLYIYIYVYIYYSHNNGKNWSKHVGTNIVTVLLYFSFYCVLCCFYWMNRGTQTYRKSRSHPTVPRRESDGVKHVPYRGPTNIRCHRTRFRRHSDLASGIFAPLVIPNSVGTRTKCTTKVGYLFTVIWMFVTAGTVNVRYVWRMTVEEVHMNSRANVV